MPEDKLEVEVSVENLTSRRSAEFAEEEFIAVQTLENEKLDKDNDINDQTLKLEPGSPSSNKSVLVYEAWKQYRQHLINQ